MKNKVFVPLLTFIALNGALAGTPAPAQQHSAASSGEFKLKNRSAFTASGTARNPFWPVGWAKAAPEVAATAAPAAVTVKAADFNVTSILLNEPPLAMINGKPMAEGEMVQVEVNGQKIVVQLAAVQDGQVVLRYLNQNIVVPLRRKGESLATPSGAAATDAATALR